MQLNNNVRLSNKVRLVLAIIMSVITVTACSSSKKISSNDQKIGENIVDTAASTTANGSNNVSSEDIRLHLQHIQQNNIVYFDLNQYDILPDFAMMLNDHASFLRSNPSYKVTIEGHTDERGTSEYNISLGERRANSIRVYLQSKGVLSDQIYIVSYGEEKPAVLGHDELSYAKNRRAVLIY